MKFHCPHNLRFRRQTALAPHLTHILDYFGIFLELLSACLVAEVCQASKVFFNAKRAFVDDTRIIQIYALAE